MNVKKIMGYGISITFAIASFLYWQNKGIVITRLNYEHHKLPNAFKGYRLLQVSDLHNTLFGKHQKNLLSYTKKISPDCVLITGDIIDCHRIDIKAAVDYVKAAVKIAPVYYVAGNHEGWSGVYDVLKKELEQVGAQVLDDKVIRIEKEGERIQLIGLQDQIVPDIEVRLGNLVALTDSTDFSILLSHRPEYIESYARFPIDLVFSGHAHGGQIRLPIIGALYAPGQGILPTYTEGIYKSGQTSMIVSRGLGNSVFPFRIFNRPQLVSVTLQ